MDIIIFISNDSCIFWLVAFAYSLYRKPDISFRLNDNKNEGAISIERDLIFFLVRQRENHNHCK